MIFKLCLGIGRIGCTRQNRAAINIHNHHSACIGIFSIPPRNPNASGRIHECELTPEKLVSAINITKVQPKAQEKGIEDAEVLVVAGRGVRKAEDLTLLQELADLLGGKLASTRALVEAGWIDARRQIGLSGRTVKPKLIITCGVSGAIQFVAGMNGAEKIIAINGVIYAETL